MNCNTCINHNGRICETMTKPMKDFACYMTKEDRIAAEKAIIKYCGVYADVNRMQTAKRHLARYEKR